MLEEMIERGLGVDEARKRLEGLEETLRLTSICGLGQVALGPVLSVTRLPPSSGPEGLPVKGVGH